MNIHHNSQQLAWLIRRHGVEMTYLSGGSHLGAILSVADIMGVLYAEVLKFDASNPSWNLRDRFILSKGHAGASVYAALAESGFFPVEELKSHYQNGSRLSGHVSHHLPGVDFSTGSLGHGLGVGTGMAYALLKDARIKGLKEVPRVFVVLGDGECNEGSVWEAALFANHFRISNLVAIVDHNKMQSLDFNSNTLDFEDLALKWRAFGWNVIDIDGNSHSALREAFASLSPDFPADAKPTVIIANTVKGKGIPFMENDILWHYRFPHDGWEYDMAVTALHDAKPDGVLDPYTPSGIPSPHLPPPDADIYRDHTLSSTFHPTWNSKLGC